MVTAGSLSATAGGRKMRAKPKTKAGKAGKVADVMHEFKAGKLHSGSKTGPKVTKPKQAIAIAMNQAGMKKKGARRGR